MNANPRGTNRHAPRRKRLFGASALAVLVTSACVAAPAQQRPPQPPQTQPPPQTQQTQPPPQTQQPQSSRQQPAKPPAPKAPASVPAAPPAGQTPAQKWFTDVELVDQDGRKHRLYSDLLKGKTVIVNAFFATCKGVCAPMSQNLQRVQEAFKERVGKDLHIISITVDPETDTPAMLKDYAKKYGATPGRYFVTGKKENVDWALYKLGQYVEQKEAHTSIFIVGNEATGLWKKLHGMANIAEIVKGVESVLNDRGTAAATGGGAK